MSILVGLRYTVGSIANRAFELTLPVTCAGCYRPGTTLCGDCRSALEERLAAGSSGAGTIVSKPPAALHQLEWCGRFEGITRRALERFTLGGERGISEPLGRAIANHWANTGTDADVVVPIPTTSVRVRQLGYDHGVLLGRVAARRLDLPVPQVLRRTPAGFDVLEPARIVGRSIVLVDDVVVTGATLGAAASALLAAGARAVSAITVARDDSHARQPMLALAAG
jgi:predicted amidophosphoribosyltransferase